MPVPAGISLPMMMFSFRPSRPVGPRLDGGLGEHPGRLLERGGRQPRVGGQRRLGDAHELGTALGRRLALLHELAVDVGVHLASRPARRGGSPTVAGLLHGDPARHLPDDQLDVLVVDRHALVAVHLLDLAHEVLLGLADAPDLEQFLRVTRRLLLTDDRIARPDLLAVGNREPLDAWAPCASPRSRRRRRS